MEEVRRLVELLSDKGLAVWEMAVGVAEKSATIAAIMWTCVAAFFILVMIGSLLVKATGRLSYTADETLSILAVCGAIMGVMLGCIALVYWYYSMVPELRAFEMLT